jgi:hypothetical protein
MSLSGRQDVLGVEPATPGVGGTFHSHHLKAVDKPTNLVNSRSLGAQPVTARGANTLQVLADQTPEPVVNRDEKAARDENPCLRNGIALRVDRSRCLPTFDDFDDETVHLVDLRAHRRSDHGVPGGLVESLQPEVDKPQAVAS